MEHWAKIGESVFFWQLSLRKKCQYWEFFWSAFYCIHSECGKMRTRKTPNMDTFHAMFDHDLAADQFAECSKCPMFKRSLSDLLCKETVLI